MKLFLREPLVRRPGGRSLISFPVGYSTLILAVGIHDIDMVLPFSARSKGDIPSIRGPAGIFIIPLIRGQLHQMTSIDFHRVDVELPVGHTGIGDPNYVDMGAYEYQD